MWTPDLPYLLLTRPPTCENYLKEHGTAGNNAVQLATCYTFTTQTAFQYLTNIWEVENSFRKNLVTTIVILAVCIFSSWYSASLFIFVPGSFLAITPIVRHYINHPLKESRSHKTHYDTAHKKVIGVYHEVIEWIHAQRKIRENHIFETYEKFIKELGEPETLEGMKKLISDIATNYAPDDVNARNFSVTAKEILKHAKAIAYFSIPTNIQEELLEACTEFLHPIEVRTNDRTRNWTLLKRPNYLESFLSIDKNMGFMAKNGAILTRQLKRASDQLRDFEKNRSSTMWNMIQLIVLVASAVFSFISGNIIPASILGILSFYPLYKQLRDWKKQRSLSFKFECEKRNLLAIFENIIGINKAYKEQILKRYNESIGTLLYQPVQRGKSHREFIKERLNLVNEYILSSQNKIQALNLQTLNVFRTELSLLNLEAARPFVPKDVLDKFKKACTSFDASFEILGKGSDEKSYTVKLFE